MRFLRGPWQWMTEGGMSYWAPPPGFTGLDLRTLPQQAQQGGAPGLGIFYGTGDPGSDYDLLGQGNWHDVKATQRLKDALPAPTGYRPKGDDLVGLILDLLTDGSDPDGLDGPKPLMPTTQGRIELHLGQSHHERFRWGGNGTPKIKRLLRKEFAQLMQDVQDGKMRAKQHLRVMDFWCEKYKVDDWREFVPDALQKDVPGRVPHETTITDNFNRADSATLGTSSEGWSWTETDGNTDIASNIAVGKTGQDNNRAETDLSSSDHYAQVTSILGSASQMSIGVCLRHSSSVKTAYILDCYTPGTPDTWRIFKRITGTFTSLGTSTNNLAANDVIKGEANGSSIASYQNGTSRTTVTDTSIASGTRTGIRGSNESVNWQADNFSAADLGGGAGILYTQLERGTRGVLRGMYTKY